MKVDREDFKVDLYIMLKKRYNFVAVSGCQFA